MLLLLLLLVFKLAVLTIIEGEEYRYNSNIKTIKNIPVKAPRGKIYDKNGVVLADNISSLTVQILKDEIESGNFNKTAFLLSKILDKNGENVIDEFPIMLDTYEYLDNDFSSEYELIIDEIILNNQVEELIEYESLIYGEKINIKELALLVLNKEMGNLPIEIENNEYIYIANDEEAKIWLEMNNYSSDLLPKEVIIEMFTKDKKYLRRLLSNSKIRRVTYEMLKDNVLIENLKIVPYAFSYDNEFKRLKQTLSLSCNKITYETTAKEDFVNLTIEYSIDELLHNIYFTDEEQVVPAIKLYELITQIEPNIPVIYNVEDNKVEFVYINNNKQNKYLNDLELPLDTTAYELIMKIALDNELLSDLITDEQVKYYAQSELLNYINPSIAVAYWQYTPLIKKNTWIKENFPQSNTYDAEEIFKLLREKTGLEETINDYDARNIFVIRERYIKQGYLAYHPIDICYGASYKTIAMLLERSYELPGVNVEVEPQRYYPLNDTAAHIIGYLGKISQNYEIDEYINEGNYQPDDIIGKTGIEEKFEKILKGHTGKKTVEVNALGATIKSINEESPIPGDDIYLTIDVDLQKTAEESLEKALEQIQIGGVYESEWGDFNFEEAYKNAKSGALVAIDVKTGEILALVNYPSYDLNLFSTGITSEDWEGLLNDSKDPLSPRPLYNISLLTAIQPGSTFKIITALAALEKGIPPEEKVYCAGTMEIGYQHYGCWIWNIYRGAHGYENLYEAIRDSCNFYFWTVVLGENQITHEKTSQKVELEDILDMAKKFGLNDKTGIEIDIPREHSGGIPNPTDKIESIKLYLRRYLDNNIENYFEENAEVNSLEKQKKIDEIVSWANFEEAMTRNEVYIELEKMQIDPLKLDEKGVPIVDIIKYSYLNQAVWNIGDTMNISIGQGSNSYTPIQIANYISIVANDGYKHDLSIIKEGLSYDRKNIVYNPERNVKRIELNDYNNLKYVREGMRQVAESSRIYKKFPIEVGAKTGTAEKDGINPETGETYDDFGWYVAFAPYDDPQIAVAAVMFQGGSGRYPSPVVRDVIAKYLGLNFEDVNLID